MTDASQQRTLVVVGNNCFIDPGSSGAPTYSELDFGMLKPFIDAWGGPAKLLVLETATDRTRTRTFPDNVSTKSLMPQAFSRGMRRVLATPIIAFKMLQEISSSDAVYGRLPSPMGSLALVVANLRGARTFCSVHGMPAWTRRRTKGLRGRISSTLGRAIYTRILDRAIIRFATDPQSLEAYSYESLTSVPLHTTLIESVPIAPSSLPQPRPKPRVGYVGRLEKEKNPLLLIRAVAELRSRGVDAEVEIVGSGTLLADVRELSRNLQVPLAEHGWLDSREAVTEVMANFDVCVVPSLSEGNPKVVIESMAVGVPALIYPHNQRVREIASHGGVVLVDSFEPSDWADRLLESLAPARYIDLSTNGRKGARPYTIENLTKSIASEYRKAGLR